MPLAAPLVTCCPVAAANRPRRHLSCVTEPGAAPGVSKAHREVLKHSWYQPPRAELKGGGSSSGLHLHYNHNTIIFCR